jgi:hypothetical protein
MFEAEKGQAMIIRKCALVIIVPALLKKIRVVKSKFQFVMEGKSSGVYFPMPYDCPSVTSVTEDCQSFILFVIFSSVLVAEKPSRCERFGSVAPAGGYH